MTQPRSSRPFLQAALNGDRMHPAAPHTPAQIAAEALAAVRAGAQSVHVHPFDDNGAQTLAPEPCVVTIRAVRAAWRRQRSSRYTVATASPPGRSIGAPSRVDTAFGPVWRTRRFCPTGAWPTATAISLRLPPRCSPTARLNSRAAIRRRLTA